MQATIVRRHFRRVLNLYITRADARAISFHTQGSGVVLDFLEFAGVSRLPLDEQQLKNAFRDYVVQASVGESMESRWDQAKSLLKKIGFDNSNLLVVLKARAATLLASWGKRYTQFRARRLLDQLEADTVRKSISSALRISRNSQNGLANTLRCEIFLSAIWEIAVVANRVTTNSETSIENALRQIAANHGIFDVQDFTSSPKQSSKRPIAQKPYANAHESTK